MFFFMLGFILEFLLELVKFLPYIIVAVFVYAFIGFISHKVALLSAKAKAKYKIIVYMASSVAILGVALIVFPTISEYINPLEHQEGGITADWAVFLPKSDQGMQTFLFGCIMVLCSALMLVVPLENVKKRKKLTKKISSNETIVKVK